MVDKDPVYDLRLQMSGKGLPAGQDTGYALLDQQGITTSEFQQQVTYQRALEGELSKTLEALDGVNQAVVHVALPKDEVFVTDQAKPTASVLLDLAPGTQLSGEQIQAVTNLVSSSVQDMDPDQVTVTDSTGHVLSAAGHRASPPAPATPAPRWSRSTRRGWPTNAQQILDTVVGPGHAKVSVRADVDLVPAAVDVGDLHLHRTTRRRCRRAPPPRSTAAAAPRSAASSARRTCPTRRPTPAAAGLHLRQDVDDGQQRRRQDDGDRRGRAGCPQPAHRLGGDGQRRRRQPQPAADPVDLVGNAVGLDTARGDAITVASMPFDTTAAEAGRGGPGGGQAQAESSAQMWSMIRTGGIAAGIALVVLLVWLRSRRQEEIEEEYEPLELTDDMLAELDRLRVASSREERPKIDNRQLELEAAERQKVRGEISTMVSERPDEVAAMLRGWLSENKA